MVCLRAVGTLALIALAPASGSANLGPPTKGGQLVAEPDGIKDVEINRETLTIDMRPLSNHGHVLVEAVYQLHNHGDEKKLDLLFASGAAETMNLRVWLGDQLIASRLAEEGTKLPKSWQAPRTTPGIEGDDELAIRYRGSEARPASFSIVLPPGRHTLKVQYAADAVHNRARGPTVCRQFAYVLAPARSWAGFGGLDVTIHVPEGWDVACSGFDMH
jgi:hypothetical protein